MNNIDGRDLFKALSKEILNSELTDEQVALFALWFHRTLTEEAEKATNTIRKERSTIKSVQGHTQNELKTLKRIDFIKTYRKSLISIKKSNHDLLEAYFDNLANENQILQATDKQIYQDYYNNEVYTTRDNLSYNQCSNAQKKLHELLRGFKTKAYKE